MKNYTKNNFAMFDTIDIRRKLCDIDGLRNLRYGVSINYDENNYLDQYKCFYINDNKSYYFDCFGG